VKAFFCTKCESEETCRREASQPEIARKLVFLLEKLDEEFRLQILENVNWKTVATLMPYFQKENKEQILNSLPFVQFIHISFNLLEGDASFFDNIQLQQEREDLVKFYSWFLQPDLDENDIIPAGDFLNGLTSIDSAVILSNVLRYRKEKNLSFQPIISLGKYLNDEVIAEFLSFDDYWQTNFSVITTILTQRGEDSTARIFDFGDAYSVAMILKSEKLSPDFVASVFAVMDEEQVMKIVDHLLNSPFVGNEQDSVPYLQEVIDSLEDENPELADRLSSAFDINTHPEEGSNFNYAPIEEVGIDNFYGF
jgi:hypothetical protein